MIPRPKALAAVAHALAFVAMACGPSGTDQDAAITLSIEPPDPVLVMTNGSPATVQFQVRATSPDGSSALLDEAAWSLEPVELGALGEADGLFAASGAMAGVATVRVLADDRSATTTVTVRIENELLGDGVPPDGPDRFTDPPMTGTAESPVLLYPLDQALMPSSIKPPHVQWEGGSLGDLYRVIIRADLAEVTAYLVHDGVDFDFAWPVASASWSMLKASAGDEPLTFTVDRWSMASSETHGSATRAVRIAEAEVTGAIYYWDLSNGRMLRITDAGREDFMPSPPPRAGDGARCVACHTVSRDGRFLAAELWEAGDFSTIFDLAVDPAPMVVPPDRYRALSSSFSPDSSRLIINNGNLLGLVDAATGMPVTPGGTPLPTTGAAHPSWSPDGSLIAYIANHNGPTWGVDFTTGDLAVIPVTGPDTFGPTVVRRPADGMANAWPSFSPDSQWIAFGRGTNSRGRNGDTAYPGSLYLIHRDGGGAVELALAAGGQQNSYLPNFSPFDEAGYFWLAFYSTRDYGNAQAGTKGGSRRQLWVTAISRDPATGADPSHVPYWLPDQDVATHNMSGYWAPVPPVE